MTSKTEGMERAERRLVVDIDGKRFVGNASVAIAPVVFQGKELVPKEQALCIPAESESRHPPQEQVQGEKTYYVFPREEGRSLKISFFLYINPASSGVSYNVIFYKQFVNPANPQVAADAERFHGESVFRYPEQVSLKGASGSSDSSKAIDDLGSWTHMEIENTDENQTLNWHTEKEDEEFGRIEKEWAVLKVSLSRLMAERSDVKMTVDYLDKVISLCARAYHGGEISPEVIEYLSKQRKLPVLKRIEWLRLAAQQSKAA